MPRIHQSDRAHEDLSDIWRFIAKDKPTAADRLIRSIDGTFKSLAEHPAMGAAASA